MDYYDSNVPYNGNWRKMEENWFRLVEEWAGSKERKRHTQRLLPYTAKQFHQ